MRQVKLARALIGVMATLLVANTAYAQIKIGVLATLDGALSVPGQDAMRGADMAVRERNNLAGGKRIEIIKASSNGTPDIAVNAARKLVEQDKVDILVGPLSGGEGIAVKNYAKTQPGITFINGSSASQATTLIDPSVNFFRYSTDGAQQMVGLGSHAFSKGYKRIAMLAEDYSFPYALIQGFMADYCKVGGRVVEKIWVPFGTKDYAAAIAKIPPGIDALFVALGGADAVNFLTQYEQAGGDRPLIAGAITVDQTVLGSKGKRRDSLIGTPSSGPVADNLDTPEWKKFVAAYKAAYPDGNPSPSGFALSYYVAMTAALQALDTVKGDVGNNQTALRQALTTQVIKAPVGDIRLDENRSAIAPIFVTEVALRADGTLFNKVVKSVPAVSQNLGLGKAEFEKMGLGSRTNPECK